MAHAERTRSMGIADGSRARGDRPRRPPMPRRAHAPSWPRARLRPGPSGLAPGLPIGLVFAVFFVLPLVLVGDRQPSGTTTTTRSCPPSRSAATSRTSRAAIDQLPDLCTILKTYHLHGEVLLHRLGTDLGDRLHRSRISSPSTSARSPCRSTLALLCTIPFWTSNVIRMISWIPLLGRNGLVNQALDRLRCMVVHAAGRVAALFAVLGGAGLRPPLHLLHGGPDLQLHGAHRQAADRGRLRRRRQRLADAVERRRPALQARHRHRLDLRRHHRDGRFRHRRA